MNYSFKLYTQYYIIFITIAYPSIAMVTTPAMTFVASNGVLTLSIDVTRIKVKIALI